MLIMWIWQRLGIGSSVIAFGTAVAGAIENQPLGNNPYLQIASVAVITAIGSMVGPWIMAAIKMWGDKRIQELEHTVKTLQEKADKAEAAEAEADRAKIEVVRYQERLQYLEGRVDRTAEVVNRNVAAMHGVKEVIRKEVLTGKGIQLSPVASVVTDAYGKILTASGQIEFILQWKPEEMIGRNIREFIPKPLHPDPINHESRSFNPNIEFNERTLPGVDAVTKEGATVKIDVRLTRWFEKGQRGSIAGVRFGKLIRKHQGTDLDMPVVDFPPIDEYIPGIPHEEIARNTAVIAENNAKLTETNAKLDTLISEGSGVRKAIPG